MGLDIVELVMGVEAAFRVEVPDADAERLRTVGDLYDFVRDRVAPDGSTGAAGPYAGALWERYVDVVARETGVPRDRLRPRASLVADLGLD
jgi:acyl carrier protein